MWAQHQEMLSFYTHTAHTNVNQLCYVIHQDWSICRDTRAWKGTLFTPRNLVYSKISKSICSRDVHQIFNSHVFVPTHKFLSSSLMILPSGESPSGCVVLSVQLRLKHNSAVQTWSKLHQGTYMKWFWKPNRPKTIPQMCHPLWN